MHRQHLAVEMENLVKGALASERLISPTIRGLGLISLGWFYQNLAPPTAKDCYSDARKIGFQEEDVYLQMQGLAGEAQIDFISGDEESALLKTDQALKLAEQLGDEEIPWILRMYMIGTIPQQDRQEVLLKCIEEANIMANTNITIITRIGFP